MTRVVLDASALIVLLLDEPGAEAVRGSLEGSAMAAPNLAEVVGHFASRGGGAEEIERMIALIPVDIVPADHALSIAAGLLRGVSRDAGLSLGDRFCLALEARLALPALTADRAWASVGPRIGVEVRLVR